jgi:hypothetical protein
MRKKRPIIVVTIIMLGFVVGSVACAQEEAEQQDSLHKLALFAGGGFERDKHGHEENGAAVGVIYELEFSEKWGAGVALEYLSGGGTQRSWVVAVPVSYHVTPKWRLFAGPGMEFASKHDKYLMRVGVAYEIPFNERWTASPEFIVDFIESGATTYLLGFSLGYGF